MPVLEQIKQVMAEAADAGCVTGRAGLLTRILDDVPARITYIDAEWTYRIANRAFLREHGLTRSLVVGRALRDVLPAATYRQVAPLIRRALSGQQVETMLRLRLPDGARRVRVSLTPDVLLDGDVLGVTILSLNAMRQGAAGLTVCLP